MSFKKDSYVTFWVNPAENRSVRARVVRTGTLKNRMPVHTRIKRLDTGSTSWTPNQCLTAEK